MCASVNEETGRQWVVRWIDDVSGSKIKNQQRLNVQSIVGRASIGGVDCVEKNMKKMRRSCVPDQYRRLRLVTSREVRRIWRFTAAAAFRLRSCVGFS